MAMAALNKSRGPPPKQRHTFCMSFQPDLHQVGGLCPGVLRLRGGGALRAAQGPGVDPPVPRRLGRVRRLGRDGANGAGASGWTRRLRCMMRAGSWISTGNMPEMDLMGKAGPGPWLHVGMASSQASCVLKDLLDLISDDSEHVSPKGGQKRKREQDTPHQKDFIRRTAWACLLEP